jgi:cytochrome c peroxidase
LVTEGAIILKKRAPFLLCLSLCFILLFGVHPPLQIQGTLTVNGLTPIESLGKNLFFDTNLSTPSGTACAACHVPETGYTGPNSTINANGAVYPGAVDTRFSARAPPSAGYAGESPVLHYNETKFQWIGGMFFDGRATGWTLGDPLAEQAQGPFLNPVEQNNPNPSAVVQKVMISDYAGLFEEVWGNGSLNDVNEAYNRIAMSIAAYERSSEVSPFTSKYDAYLAGNAGLTELEAQGLKLFEGKAMCSSCHLSQPGSSGTPPLFTDFTYWNLGIPKNPENPFYNVSSEFNPDGSNYLDYGLGGFLKNASYPSTAYNFALGTFKVATLRNVDLRPTPEFVKSYGHNGYFKSLEEIVHFYNTRDVGNWSKPEVSVNLDTMHMGNLNLTLSEETAIVAYLKTLSDGYTPEPSVAVIQVVLIGAVVVVLTGLVVFAVLKKYKIHKKPAGLS